MRALVSGVLETSSGFCFTAVTFGGGYLIASLGFPALFAVGSAVTALSAALFWILFRTRAPLGGAANHEAHHGHAAIPGLGKFNKSEAGGGVSHGCWVSMTQL
jgi:hypothetical protein